MIMNNKIMLIGGVVILVVALFAWPAISPDTAPQAVKDVTTTIAGDHQYVTPSFSVDTWYSVTESAMYSDISFTGSRWSDNKGWDVGWFTTSSDVVAYVDLTYEGKTYYYSHNMGKVSTFSRETHNFDIVSDITEEIYTGGAISYTITVKEGDNTLNNGQHSGSFTMG